MVRFSCFPTHIHSYKPKKSVQLSADAMHKTLEDCSASQMSKTSTNLGMTNRSELNIEGDALTNSVYHVEDSYTDEADWKSEQIEQKSNTESDVSVRRMRKSMSLGSGLDRRGKVSSGNESGDETDQKFSGNGSFNHSELVGQNSSKGFQINTPDQEAEPSDSLQENAELGNIESIFSIPDPQESGKEAHENSDLHSSGAGESDDPTPRAPPNFVKSSSLPDLKFPVHHSTSSLRRSRSAKDLDLRRKEMSKNEIGTKVIQHEERDGSALNNGTSYGENAVEESYDAYNYVGSAKEWIVPVMDEVTNNNYQRKSSISRWDELPSEDFKIKRIQEWVFDLQHCSPLEEINEPSPSNGHEELQNDTILDSPAAKLDGKVNPSMEGVKRYLSSLSLSSTTAQLVNHGLVVIPFLSAFTSLKALNLSGNSIVRITAGSLPRGLHVLNLSKNNISIIEGLRELTRLRILDLSYNRILRLGHGLASCSSLKELYLAGNKISEVEGLHRLLKLNVLDLRFNKISTTKCLGQLAANYSSLQAIGLDGNPAQKNIGDEQLKKYLQGLLPQLAYYNRQPIKAGTLKDTADRSARVSISSHQVERNLRSELKPSRKGSSHGVAPHKASSSSIHGRKSQAIASSKASRSRNGRLPPSGTKISTDRHNMYEYSSKLLNFKPHLSIPKSRSEGTLAAL